MKSLAVLALATLLLALFFQCCPTSSSELAPVQGPSEQAATPAPDASPESRGLTAPGCGADPWT